MTFRPAFHVVAAHTWLNDPNGLFFRDGTWHAFYQTNPHALHWDAMSWGHATSPDLATWTDQPIALRHTDDEMAFSGSVVVDHQRLFAVDADEPDPLVAVFTAHREATDALPRHEAQALAISHDEGRTFQRFAGNPVLDLGSANFRDPKVFWWGHPDTGHWVMVTVEAELRRVLLHVSDDLVHWTPTQQFGPAGVADGIWECPDLVEVRDPVSGDTAWALLVSLYPGGPCTGSGTQYFLGDFDGRRFTWGRSGHPGEAWRDHGWLDLGPDNYASVTYHRPPPRADGAPRVLVQGWASNWSYTSDTPTVPDGFRNCLTAPRELWLDAGAPEPRLVQSWPAELLAAFEPARSVPRLTDGSLDLAVPLGLLSVAARGDFDLELDGLRLARHDDHLVVARPAESNLPVSDDFGVIVDTVVPAWGRSRGAGKNTVHLDVLLDRCTAEVMVDGITLTFSRYPAATIPPRFRGEGEVTLNPCDTSKTPDHAAVVTEGG